MSRGYLKFHLVKKESRDRGFTYTWSRGLRSKPKKKYKEDMNMSKKSKMMKRRRRFFSVILVVALVATLGGGVYLKSHHVETCKVLNVVNNTVFVKHSNGLTYMVAVEDPELYRDTDTAKVVFNQLTDWSKYYYIIDISPIK